MTLEERIDALEARVALLEGSSNATTTPGPAKKTSLRELINNLKPKSSTDTALIIAHHYEIGLQQGYFTNDNLKAGFAEAKMIAPKNIPDVVFQNAKKGRIMPTDSTDAKAKAWVLTNTGEDYVQSMAESNDQIR